MSKQKLVNSAPINTLLNRAYPDCWKFLLTYWTVWYSQLYCLSKFIIIMREQQQLTTKSTKLTQSQTRTEQRNEPSCTSTVELIKQMQLFMLKAPFVWLCGLSSVRTSKTASAASIPLFIALWVPLILATFMKPGLQPTKHPPGNVSFGKH